jgi:hypothetical protein
MLLNVKTFIVITLIGLSAQAQKITSIGAGSYTLDSGEKNLCADFSLSDKDASAKNISIGGRYIYETVNSTHNVESDIDSNCEFREKNLREDHGDSETTLTRVNEEYCKGNLRSRTTSIATLRPNEIELHYEIEGADPYTCLWKKQDKKK